MHLKNNRFFSYTLLHHLRLNNLHIDHIQLPYSNDQSPVMLHFFLEKNTIFLEQPVRCAIFNCPYLGFWMVKVSRYLFLTHTEDQYCKKEFLNAVAKTKALVGWSVCWLVRRIHFHAPIGALVN